MIRLFIAFPLPKEIEDYLLEISKKIVKKGMTGVHSIHITTNFLGFVEEKSLPEIMKRLEKIMFSPFNLQLHDLGFFPDNKHPKVVWVGVAPHAPILDVKEQVETALQGLFPKEDRFYPHLTLARVKFLRNKNSIENMKKIRIEKKEFLIDTLILYKSTITKNGAEYEEVWKKKAA